MYGSKLDLSIFEKLQLENHPVGVKYSFLKPENVENIGKSMALCEMLNEVNKRGKPFYATKDNEDCVGKVPMGWEDTPPPAEAGLIGPRWGTHEEPRANAQIYKDVPRFSRGVVNYVVFSPLDKMDFDPDVLFVLADIEQAEIVMRSMSYSTGELFESKMTNVMGCAYLFAYPYHQAKVNYIPTGMGFGMKAREVFPSGQFLVAIPFQWLPTMVRNLEEMTWELPAYRWSKEEFLQAADKLHEEIGSLVEE